MWFGEPHPFPENLPNWERRDNKVTKDDRVETVNVFYFWHYNVAKK